MDNFYIIILVWLAFFGGAMAGAVAVWQLMDRRETERERNIDKNIADLIGKDFFKGLR